MDHNLGNLTKHVLINFLITHYPYNPKSKMQEDANSPIRLDLGLRKPDK